MARPRSSTATDVLMAARFIGSIGPFLRSPLSADESRQRLLTQLRRRAVHFLALVRDAVYGRADSPYLALLRHAGVEYGDVERLVRHDGVEGALSSLYDAGVHVSIDEFKGRRPIRRGQLEIPTTAASFDNALPSQHFVARTGGSRSDGQRLLIDLELLAHEACYELLTSTQFEHMQRPRALWRPVPPGTAGLKTLLRFAKIAAPFARWYSPNPVHVGADWRYAAFTSGVVIASRLAGYPLARPRHLPIENADVIARWLADRRSEGIAGVVDTNASAAVRVCHAASALGLDIRQSFFRVSGEPLSPGKAAVFARHDCQSLSHYSMSEAGRIANACADPLAPDDAHVALDKVALLQRNLRVGGAIGPTVPALLLTTLIRSSPRVMLNVEIGDYAVLTTRACACAWQRLGFTQHVHDIRSYEKLTAEGMHFVGSDLESVLDEALPARFGGGPTDYQLVEEEHEGVTTIVLRVSPRVGAVDNDSIRETLLHALSKTGPAQRMMADRWRTADIVRVVRADPKSTSAGKILALHMDRTRAR